MNRWERIEEILSDVRDQANIVAVAEYVLGVGLKRAGSSYTGVCPSCGASKRGRGGNWMLSPSKKIHKCFVCEFKGDVISLYAQVKNVSYVEAGLLLAKEYLQLISDDEMASLLGKRFSSKKLKEMRQKFSMIDAAKMKELSKRADVQIIDFVYEKLIRLAGLSAEDKQYLVEVRGLSEKEILEGDFFSFPTRRVLKKLFAEIRGANLREMFPFLGSFVEREPLSILKYVPGFFFETKKNVYYDEKRNSFVEGFANEKLYKLSDIGQFSFSKMKGLAFPLKNLKGQKVGIQVRLSDESIKEGKYRFFSSSWAIAEYPYQDKDGKIQRGIWGASPGSPIMVEVPQELKSNRVAITEGKFKAMRLAKESGMVVITVQGVSSWRGIGKVLEGIGSIDAVKERFDQALKKHCPERAGAPFKPKLVFVAFDADSMLKYAVHHQSRRMVSELSSGDYDLRYLIWDFNIAKGIDDLYDEAKEKDKGWFSKHVQVVEKTEWGEAYKEVYAKVKEITGKPDDFGLNAPSPEDMERHFLPQLRKREWVRI